MDIWTDRLVDGWMEGYIDRWIIEKEIEFYSDDIVLNILTLIQFSKFNLLEIYF